MGISLRAYARHRGCSDTAVRKAFKAGRITPEADGTIDATKADQQWASNTDKSQQRQKKPKPANAMHRATGESKPVPNAAINSVNDTLRESDPVHFDSAGNAHVESTGGASGGTTYMQARTANEVLKAQANRLKLQQLKGELVDRAQALSHVFRLARTERDTWIAWPARVSSQMAAELEVDPHLMHVTLESYVREHLSELADIKPKVD